jgi:hypothetical protein
MLVGVCQDVLEPVAKVAEGIVTGVEIPSAVPFAVEIPVSRQSIVTMHRDVQLDAIRSSIYHDIVEAIEDCIIPLTRLISLQRAKRFNVCSFLGRRCTCIIVDLVL